MIPVECYFALSALLFFIGVYGFTTRRNLIAMLISVELVLNAVDINFAAINRLLYPNGMEGMFMTLFVIGVAAAESAVAIAIIINVYRKFKSDSVEAIQNMKREDILHKRYIYLLYSSSGYYSLYRLTTSLKIFKVL